VSNCKVWARWPENRCPPCGPSLGREPAGALSRRQTLDSKSTSVGCGLRQCQCGAGSCPCSIFLSRAIPDRRSVPPLAGLPSSTCHSLFPGGPLRSAQPKIVCRFPDPTRRLCGQPTLLHFSSLRLCVFLDQTQACISCGKPRRIGGQARNVVSGSGKQQCIPDAAMGDGQWDQFSCVEVRSPALAEQRRLHCGYDAAVDGYYQFSRVLCPNTRCQRRQTVGRPNLIDRQNCRIEATGWKILFFATVFRAVSRSAA
jgi:hypothetical protein